MSYCRMNGEDSDAYIIATVHGYECISCKLFGDRNYTKTFITEEPGRMLAHMYEHRSHGHKIPERATEQMRKDATIVLGSYKNCATIIE